MTGARFGALEHPSFPKWLVEGLEALFAADERFESVNFSLWGSTDEKCRYVDLEGSAGFTYRNHACVATRMAEDELDRIPQVRMLERRAGEMWNHLPLAFTIDEGFSLNGDYEFKATRDSIVFRHQLLTGSEPEFVIGAEWRDGAWRTRDAMAFSDYDGTHSDLLAGDAEEAMSHMDAADLFLAELPTPLAVDVDADELVVFGFEAGEISRCMAKR